MPEDGRCDTSVLTSLFRHNTWANLKLLDFCENLSDEQLQTAAVGTYGSIRATLAHFVGAEMDYVSRVTGERLPAWLQGEEFPGFEALKEGARWAGERLSQVAVAARSGDIVRETDPQETAVVEYPLSSFLVQAINHATEHREQVSATITQLGIKPPDMTGWGYMEETGEFRERPTGIAGPAGHEVAG